MSDYIVEENGIYIRERKYGENAYRMIISKEAIIEAVNKWVVPTINNFDSKDVVDACKFYYEQGQKNFWERKDDVPNIILKSACDNFQCEKRMYKSYLQGLKDCSALLDELEQVYRKQYGTEIIEMYADIHTDFREWLNEQIKEQKNEECE